MKQWAILCRASQEGGSWWRVLTKHGPLEGEGAMHPNILSMRTPWTVWNGKMISHWKISPPGWKVPNILLGKNRGKLPKALERMKWLGQRKNNAQLWICLVVKVKSNAVKTNNASEHEWKHTSIIKGNLDMVTQEMGRLNTDNLRTNKIKWTWIGEFNSDDHYIYYCGQESLRSNGVVFTVNTRVQNALLRCYLKNNRMISVCFHGKLSNITVITKICAKFLKRCEYQTTLPTSWETCMQVKKQ